MSLRGLFAEIFGPAWNEAETVTTDVEHVAESVVHQAEKEIAMLPQPINDALARIRALLSSGSDQSAADAKTISDLKDANATLQGQVTDLTSQVLTVTGQRDDAVSQLNDLEQQLLAIAPPPAA